MTTKPRDDDRSEYDEQIDNPTQRADVNQWCCLNCGQHIFVVVNADPPDVCEYCKDMTTWRHVDKSQ